MNPRGAYKKNDRRSGSRFFLKLRKNHFFFVKAAKRLLNFAN